jgi:hypothetical protein
MPGICPDGLLLVIPVADETLPNQLAVLDQAVGADRAAVRMLCNDARETPDRPETKALFPDLDCISKDPFAYGNGGKEADWREAEPIQ